MDFSKWIVRASQAGLIMTGNFGISESQQEKIKYLEDKLSTGKALTELQKIEYNSLLYKRENPELSKTTTSELEKIHRQKKWGVEFFFTNKFVFKGNKCEEDSITLISIYLGIPFIKNKERRTNNFYTGEADITPDKRVDFGLDVKTSWDAETFPYQSHELPAIYEWQNLVYSDLWGTKSWKTAYCLVNCTPNMLYNEQMKYFYALGAPDQDRNPDEYEEWIDKCKKIEQKMVPDVDLFLRDYGHFDFYNQDMRVIPEKERVLMRTVEFDPDKINQLKERVVTCRKYLNSL